jgi:hypothetical protein
MTGSSDFMKLLAGPVEDSETAWSVGTFGAIAEFTRDADEAATIGRGVNSVSVVTARGGLRIAAPEALRPIASESLTAQSWNQRVALCLPHEFCSMGRRAVLTEIGPDAEALRPADQGAILFDLGLAALHIDACVRSADPAFVAALRQCAGQSLFAAGNGAMGMILAANPHRVFLSKIGRIEVFQPIPPPDGKSPDGPHTHVLPRLLGHKRTHAATEGLPAGWVPCVHFYPPHPLRDGLGLHRPFQSERHSAFQELLNRHGDPRLIAIKQRVVELVIAGQTPSAVGIATDRFGRAALRVALRQLQWTNGHSPALSAWLSAHDRRDGDEPNDSTGDHPCTA